LPSSGLLACLLPAPLVAWLKRTPALGDAPPVPLSLRSVSGVGRPLRQAGGGLRQRLGAFLRSRRTAGLAILDGLVERTIARSTSEYWFERLATAGLPYGRARPISEVVEHPQLLHRRIFAETESPVGALPRVRFPLAGGLPASVPALGEDTVDVLEELGYGVATITDLLARGVVT
jgi:CoA-transferase family III